MSAANMKIEALDRERAKASIELKKLVLVHHRTEMVGVIGWNTVGYSRKIPQKIDVGRIHRQILLDVAL
ncbi:hypothetical protein BGX34_003072 [Mortierella sp. NVP85]|nr:hypothetical protein BGX34_003072 [Mortierella sp. NVP85]